MARQISDATIGEILEMAKSGQMSANAIANEVGVATPTVLSIMREYGVETKTVGRQSLVERMMPEALEDILARYSETDEPIAQILEDFGLTHSQLYSILAQTGTPRRRYRAEKILGRKAQFDHAVQMYAQGHPLWRIKQETGIHQPQLHAELHKRGVPLRRPRNTSEEKE